jgi:hypothetical protein
MAAHAFGGLAARLGFVGLALGWLYTGLRAYLAMRARNVVSHRRWMVRDFALTFAAVTLRLWLPAATASGIAFELAYLVAAHLMLRGDTLTRLINKKPEKMQITWTSARSWFPGVVTVDELEIRGQTRWIQWYVAADDVHARITS